MTIMNAIIESATLTKEAYGMLSSILFLDCGVFSQGFGGIVLYKQETASSTMDSAAGHFIWRVLEIADVEEWAGLRGKAIRIKTDGKQIYAIGHIVKNDWFEPDTDFAINEVLAEDNGETIK